MGPFEMVVAIILIVTVGKIIQTKQKAKLGIIEDESNGSRPTITAPQISTVR